MNMTIKKLGGGGDTDVEKMMENASVLGLSLIEVMWIPKNGQPRRDVAQVVGFKFPVIGVVNSIEDDIKPEAWVDGTLKFYPDPNGRCWGYIFDIPENRALLETSLVNGWFKIVDPKVREEIVKGAESRSLPTAVAPSIEAMVKKTKREQEAEKEIKNIQWKLEESEKKRKELEDSLARTKNEKQGFVDKRATGVAVPSGETLMKKEGSNAY